VADLATCSWRRYRPEMGVAVRITLGRPPRWFGHPHEEVRLLAPPPALFRLKDDAAFEAAYEQHLNAVGVERLSQRFRDLSEKHGGRRLVLLCFEARVEDCHRGQFARWWRGQTGQRVEELDCWPTGQDSGRPTQERLF
jgi:hypothetical protein